MNDLDKIFLAVFLVPTFFWLATLVLLHNLENKINKILGNIK